MWVQSLGQEDPLEEDSRSLLLLTSIFPGWSGLPFPPPGDLSNPGIEPTSLVSPALAGGFFTVSWVK